MPLMWEENSAWDSVLDVFIFVVYDGVWEFRVFLNKQAKILSPEEFYILYWADINHWNPKKKKALENLDNDDFLKEK